MKNDDRTIGTVLSRRRALALFGATATAAVAHRAGAQTRNAAPSATVPDCIAQPEQTEGRISSTRHSIARTSDSIRRPVW